METGTVKSTKPENKFKYKRKRKKEKKIKKKKQIQKSRTVGPAVVMTKEEKPFKSHRNSDTLTVIVARRVPTSVSPRHHRRCRHSVT